MSDVKRMDIWTAVQTVLEKNPGIQAKYFISKLRDKTGLCRSVIYDHLGSFNRRGKIYREKGRYWLEKPGKLESENLATLDVLKLAAKLATDMPPWISRDVELRIGKRKVKVVHE